MSRRHQTQDLVEDDSLQESCPLCRLPDTNEMVSCDDCGRWFHCQCLGVHEDVEIQNWSCRECINAKVPAPPLSHHQRAPTGGPSQHQPSLIPALSVPRVPTPRTSISPVPSPRLRTPIVPPHCPLPNQESPTPRPRTPRPQSPLQPTPHPRPPRVSILQPDISSVSSEIAVDPDLVTKLPDKLRIRLLEEEEAIERKFLLRRFQLLHNSSGNANPADQDKGNRRDPAYNDVKDPSVLPSSSIKDHRHDNPPVALSRVHQGRDESMCIPHLKEQQLYVPVDIPAFVNNRSYFSAIDPPRVNQQPNIPAFNPPPGNHPPDASMPALPRTDQRPSIPSFSQPNHHQLPNTNAFDPYVSVLRPTAQEWYPNEPHNCPSTMGEAALLTRSQIAARYAVTKELPIFTGEPEEWPLFFATYQNTTKLCGFSPEENMARLQKCLRGKAMEAVKCQLLHPTNLEPVLSTLRMLFGRPEIIIHSVLQKINALPAPKADHLGTLVDFALAVRNMVATVKACESEEYLCNLTLLYTLVERLPPMIRLNWATHRQSLQSVTLSDFSDWLYKLAEAASMVTMPQSTGPIDNKTRRGQKNDGFFNAHTGSDAESAQNDAGNECVICHSSCEAVEKCDQFVSMDVSARWAALREHKLCRCCLKDHHGPCKFRKPCGMNGCDYKHHRLMHNDAKDKPVSPLSSGSEHHMPAPQYDLADSSQETKSCNTHRGGTKAVLFQYVPVTLHHNGVKLRTHAFLDSGSSLTLMEECLAKVLNLQGEKHPLCLRWTADTCRYEDDAMRVSLDISGTYHGSSKNSLTDVYTVKELKLPSQSISTRNLSKKYSHLDGLPMKSYHNVQPKLLIGLNNVRVIHALDSREGKPNEPVAIKTRLGWTIYGTCSSEDGPTSNVMPYNYHICFHTHESDEILPETNNNYAALESLSVCPSQNQPFSIEKERALVKQHDAMMFQNGRFSEGRNDYICRSSNRSLALRRHRYTIKRMEHNLRSILGAKVTVKSQKTGDPTWHFPIVRIFNPIELGNATMVQDKIAGFITVHSTWHFRPPTSVHMEDCWRQPIEPIKKVLVRYKGIRLRIEKVTNYLFKIDIKSHQLTRVAVDDCISQRPILNHAMLRSPDRLQPLASYDYSPLALQKSRKASQLYGIRWAYSIIYRILWFSLVRPISDGEDVVTDSSIPRNRCRVVLVNTFNDGQVILAVSFQIEQNVFGEVGSIGRRCK